MVTTSMQFVIGNVFLGKTTNISRRREDLDKSTRGFDRAILNGLFHEQVVISSIYAVPWQLS